MRPKVYPTKPLRILWLDSKSGTGYTSRGHKVNPSMGGRRTVNPSLLDILETAATEGAEMVLLTGGGLKAAKDGGHWATAETAGWEHGNHWIDSNNVTARYRHTVTGTAVTIGLASNWFGSVPVNPEQANKAWGVLSHFITKVEPKLSPMRSAGKTGAFLWGFGVLPTKFDPPALDGWIADLLHQTSGQGHIEHLVAGDYAAKHPDCVPLIDPKQTPTIDSFAVIDGRFMYASVCKELGVGPVHELGQSDAADLWQENPYAKARYRVRFTVPKDWDHIGILGMRDETNRDTWLYPNRPGSRNETWADHRELIVAAKHGWVIEPLEALRFTEKMRPLDTFAERIIRLRSEVDSGYGKGYDPVALDAAMAALRAILLHGIGRFAMRGQDTMKLANSIDAVPSDAMGTLLELPDGQFSYRSRAGLSEDDQTFYHPELAAQVWGWARANVLDANTKSGHRTGALNVDPRTLIGIETDAIYTTSLPRWAAPVEHGGADDGMVGRLRLKGFTTGRMKTPETLEARETLKKRAEKADKSKVWEENANV